MPTSIAILTISDAGSRGDRADASGDAIAAWAGETGRRVAARALVADETDAIAAQLVRWADGGEVALILTTGGTGLSPRDVTPEATRAVLEREAPGIAERLRSTGASASPHAALSRGVAGLRGRTLIVNLPGSVAGVREGLAALGPLVEHALAVAAGGGGH